MAYHLVLYRSIQDNKVGTIQKIFNAYFPFGFDFIKYKHFYYVIYFANQGFTLSHFISLSNLFYMTILILIHSQQCTGRVAFLPPFSPLRPSSQLPSFHFFALVSIPRLAKGVTPRINVLMLCCWLGIFNVAKKIKVRLLIIGGSYKGDRKTAVDSPPTLKDYLKAYRDPLSLAPPLF